MLFNRIKFYLKLCYFKHIYRKKNKYNETYPVNIFPLERVKIGNYTYGPLEIYTWGAENEMLVIGNFVSIAKGVKFILGGNHYIDIFSTYPLKVKFLGYRRESWSKGPIIIEDDVWIGMDAMILSGVKISKGAVIAAGSVVTKDVPPYAVVAGNPAQIVKYRFNENIIRDLYKINLIDLLKPDFVRQNEHMLYSKLNRELLNKLTKY